MNNIQQNPLDFQLKITSDCITPKGGLVVFFETAIALGVTERIKRLFPKPRSNRGISAHDYVMSIILMFLGGGKYLEDIRQIKSDSALCRLCGIRIVPSPDAIAKWLRDKDNLKRLQKILEYLNMEVIKRSSISEFTLDTDATLMETVKGDAPMTYKGFTGYSSLLSFLSELDLCIIDNYREGNVSAGEGVKKQLIYTDNLLKKLNKILKYFRSDSVAYNSEIINECFRRGIIFTITADQDIAVKSAIKSIPAAEWKPLFDRDGVLTERQYATTVHAMNDSNEAFTLIVQRWEDNQMSLFDEHRYRYYVIATNNGGREAQEIIHFHNLRGDAENYHKELKNGFGLEYTPTQEIDANAIYFRIGVIAHNLFVAVKRLVLGGNWSKKTISTLRWQLIFIAGKIVSHGRQLFLKISKYYFDLLQKIRSKIILAIPSSA